MIALIGAWTAVFQSQSVARKVGQMLNGTAKIACCGVRMGIVAVLVEPVRCLTHSHVAGYKQQE